MATNLYQEIATGLTPGQMNTFIVTYIREKYIRPVFEIDTPEYAIIMEMLDATRIHGNIQSIVGEGLNPSDPDVKLYKNGLNEHERAVLKRVTYTLHIYFQVIGCYKLFFGDKPIKELNMIERRQWQRFIGLILVHDMGKLWLFRLPIFFGQGHQFSADETLMAILGEREGGEDLMANAYFKDICRMAENHHYLETGEPCRDPDVIRFRKYHDSVRADEIIYAPRYFPENASCYLPEKDFHQKNVCDDYVMKNLAFRSINSVCMLKTLGHAIHSMYNDMYNQASRFFYGIHFLKDDVLLIQTSLIAHLITSFYDQETRKLPRFADDTDLIRQRLVLGFIKACKGQGLIYRPELLFTEKEIPTRCGVFAELKRRDGSSPKPQEFIPFNLSRTIALIETHKELSLSTTEANIGLRHLEVIKRDILSEYVGFEFCIDDKKENK